MERIYGSPIFIAVRGAGEAELHFKTLVHSFHNSENEYYHGTSIILCFRPVICVSI